MTSVVDTSVKHAHGYMNGAPVLTGQAGSLIPILDAVLVTGWGLKSATSLVVNGGLATLTFTGTAAPTVDSVILVSGATNEALNGEQKVTAVTSTTVTFATAAANATDAGTVTFKMAPAGWLKVYSGTNLAVYKSADILSIGMFLRVDDTATLAARVRGYESMSDVNTGLKPFPTDAQLSGGGYWLRSNSSNDYPIDWRICADSRFFTYHCCPGQGYYPVGNPSRAKYQTGCMWGFGDPIAYKTSGDPWSCALFSSNQSNTNVIGCVDGGSQSTGSVFPRPFSGIGSSQTFNGSPFVGSANSAVSGYDSTLGAFPSVIDGSLKLSRRYITEYQGVAPQDPPPRALIPGIYYVPQTYVGSYFIDNDILVGDATVQNRKLIANGGGGGNSVATASSSSGISFSDITGPWR